MEDLRPEPLRRVDAPDIARVVDRRASGGGVDRRGRHAELPLRRMRPHLQGGTVEARGTEVSGVETRRDTLGSQRLYLGAGGTGTGALGFFQAGHRRGDGEETRCEHPADPRLSRSLGLSGQPASRPVARICAPHRVPLRLPVPLLGGVERGEYRRGAEHAAFARGIHRVAEGRA
ncbi:hypothetical protein SDC9_157046 [bioreactor metagenome]|uniref:Uncharacterized protein n=1 Tax=bioreactor metagenome TaxID=1076179 RepID=A0A645FB22_9ZZZZ